MNVGVEHLINSNETLSTQNLTNVRNFQYWLGFLEMQQENLPGVAEIEQILLLLQSTKVCNTC